MFGFGYWKREAKAWEEAYATAVEGRNAALRERNDARDLCRQARSQLSAADIQLAAEKQDNEALRAKLKKADFDLVGARNSINAESLSRDAEKQDNEALRSKLKAARDALERLAAVYGWFNVARASLASERDLRPDAADHSAAASGRLVQAYVDLDNELKGLIDVKTQAHPELGTGCQNRCPGVASGDDLQADPAPLAAKHIIRSDCFVVCSHCLSAYCLGCGPYLGRA